MTDETDSDEETETVDEETDSDGETETVDNLAWTGTDTESSEDTDAEPSEDIDAESSEDTDMESFPAPAEDTDSSEIASDQGSLATPGTGDDDSELAGPETDEAFDEMAVDDVEPDEVWSDVTEGEGESEANLPAETASDDEQVDASNVVEVSKHAYCESCEHFSEAPEIRCTHDGTEILDFLDMETVRLSDCPIVAERKGLEGDGIAKGSASINDMGQD
ncbi:MAG: hypothetical protein J07HX64_02434 [halophilic archaeon J07HX64]|jgi:hypothetical protein|nr:MAG: hypothetical protein J07HX64_02434 [halophilic archaeon J07HX64]